MRPTTEIGVNRSGIAIAPEAANKMMENSKLTKPPRGDETTMAEVRIQYARDADPVGSMPEPKEAGLKAVLMDKLGERLAFERAGTRLYDALMAKCKASKSSLVPMKELKHIRDEEAMHFSLLGAAIQSLGGDPTAQTPGADVLGLLIHLRSVVRDRINRVASKLDTDALGFHHRLILFDQCVARLR